MFVITFTHWLAEWAAQYLTTSKNAEEEMVRGSARVKRGARGDRREGDTKTRGSQG